MPIIDDFDDEDNARGQKEVSLAATKLVIGQHVRILSERLMMNMQVGRKDDEVACVENMLEVLNTYVELLKATEVVTEEMIKRELAKVYEASALLTPDELARQLEEIRRKAGNIVETPVEDDGMD